MIEYTTKQIAELLQVSKPTVQKVINDLSVEPIRKENNNRAYYGHDAAAAIIKQIRPNFDLTVLEGTQSTPPNEPQNTAKPPNEPQSAPPKTAKSEDEPPNTAKPPNEELALLRSMLSVIQEQLQEKDKQLSIKDKQIQDLSDRLAEAMQLTKGQQYIAAADKTTELLEADSKRSQEEQIILDQEEQEDPEKQSNTFSEDEKEAAADQKPLPKKGFWQRLFRKRG